MIRKVLTTALGAALALCIGVATAYFATQVQVADSVIRAGSVAISTEPTMAPLSIDALAPGATVQRSMSVLNNGTLTSDVMITASKKAGFTDLYESLDCRVTCEGTELYRGKIASMTTAPVRLAPGTRGDLRFEVSLPADADKDVEGDYVRMSLYVDAEQAH